MSSVVPELDGVSGWLMGKDSQAEYVREGSDLSFRRRTGWCWNIAPQIPVTGEIHDQAQVDGIYVGSLVLPDRGLRKHVLGWQWCDTEKKAAWAALLAAVPGSAGR